MPRCAHTEPFARLDGPIVRVGRLVFGLGAVLVMHVPFLLFLIGFSSVPHDVAGQGSLPIALRHIQPDS